MHGSFGQKPLAEEFEDEAINEAVYEMRRPTGKANAKKIIALLEYQRYRCAMSGLILTKENCEADHIVPVCDGGTDDMENIQLVVKQVNRAKGTMGNKDFVAMCIAVAEYVADG